MSIQSQAMPKPGRYCAILLLMTAFVPFFRIAFRKHQLAVCCISLFGTPNLLFQFFISCLCSWILYSGQHLSVFLPYTPGLVSVYILPVLNMWFDFLLSACLCHIPISHQGVSLPLFPRLHSILSLHGSTILLYLMFILYSFILSS